MTRAAALLCVAFAITAPALADDWFDVTRMEVHSGVLLSGQSSIVTIVNAANGDFHLRTDDGEMYVIGGQILLAKGVEMSLGKEIDAVDAPGLQVQLALKLLEKAVPAGPSSVRTTKSIDVSEATEPIEVATPSAGGAYAAPWQLKGTVKRVDAKRVAFDFQFKVEQAAQPFMLSGTWERATPKPVFSDLLNISAWRAFTLGPHETKSGRGTILDYGAQELPKRFATLGDARTAAKKRAE